MLYGVLLQRTVTFLLVCNLRRLWYQNYVTVCHLITGSIIGSLKKMNCVLLFWLSLRYVFDQSFLLSSLKIGKHFRVYSAYNASVVSK